MRITHRMVSDTTVRNLRNNLDRLEALHNSITTGYAISRPSDDPIGTARALTYKSDLEAGEAFLRTMDSSRSWLNATDDALAEATSLLQNARERAVQGSNDALAPEEMQALGAEVDQILKQLIVNGNGSLRGQRLFAGEQVDSDPFELTPNPPDAFTYHGDTGQMRREYDVNSYLTINTPGEAAFGPGINALVNLRDHLQAVDYAAVSNDLDALDGALDAVLSARAEVGAKVNRLDAAESRQNLLQVNLEDLRSKSEDTDMIEAISKFSIQETVYKASLEVGGKAIQPSLLDFLR